MTEPSDPFEDEQGSSLWHKTFRDGEMLFLGLAELDTVYDVVRAMQAMSDTDVKAIVLERLYVWHSLNGPRRGLPPTEWLSVPKPDSD